MNNLPKDLKEKLQDYINLAQAFIHTQTKVHQEHDKIIKNQQVTLTNCWFFYEDTYYEIPYPRLYCVVT